mmetsp:Transcript_16060/g.26930  ORF Transcript_16060/g.26930 Transcript_16060/m.26930 type:complete len:260 (+) Transcript_16060:801-1580(+)
MGSDSQQHIDSPHLLGARLLLGVFPDLLPDGFRRDRTHKRVRTGGHRDHPLQPDLRLRAREHLGRSDVLQVVDDGDGQVPHVWVGVDVQADDSIHAAILVDEAAVVVVQTEVAEDLQRIAHRVARVVGRQQVVNEHRDVAASLPEPHGDRIHIREGQQRTQSAFHQRDVGPRLCERENGLHRPLALQKAHAVVVVVVQRVGDQRDGLHAHRCPGRRQVLQQVGHEAPRAFLVRRVPHEVTQSPQGVRLNGGVHILYNQE